MVGCFWDGVILFLVISLILSLSPSHALSLCLISLFLSNSHAPFVFEDGAVHSCSALLAEADGAGDRLWSQL